MIGLEEIGEAWREFSEHRDGSATASREVAHESLRRRRIDSQQAAMFAGAVVGGEARGALGDEIQEAIAALGVEDLFRWIVAELALFMFEGICIGHLANQGEASAT